MPTAVYSGGADCRLCPTPNDNTRQAMLFTCKYTDKLTKKKTCPPAVCCKECHANWLMQMKSDQTVKCPICKQQSKVRGRGELLVCMREAAFADVRDPPADAQQYARVALHAGYRAVFCAAVVKGRERARSLGRS